MRSLNQNIHVNYRFFTLMYTKQENNFVLWNWSYFLLCWEANLLQLFALAHVLLALLSLSLLSKSSSGHQPHKLTQVFLIYTWANSHKTAGVCSIWSITNSTEQSSGSRAAYFQYEEQTNNSDEKQLQPSHTGRSGKKISDYVNV